VYGDAEAAVVDIMADELDDATVSTDLIGFDVGARWVRVVRTGGLPILWMHLDNPQIAVTVFAPDKGAALDLAASARRAVFAARGVYTGHGLAIYDVSDAEGIAWAHNEKGGPSYTFALSLVTRPSA
jgi:hypothetical protein